MAQSKFSYEEFDSHAGEDTGLPRNTRSAGNRHALLHEKLPLPVISHFLMKRYRRATFQSWSLSTNKTIEEFIDGYLVYTGYCDRTYCYLCLKVKGNWTSADSISSGHEDNCVVVDNERKKCERFLSFVKWGGSKAIDLAGWGFKCITRGVTRCVYCVKIKCNWDICDDPISGHSSTCLFLLYLVSRRDGHVQNILRKFEYRSIESLPIPKIVLSHYLHVHVRFSTFHDKWPKYAEKSSVDLTTNYLTYVGYVDRTYCVFCQKGTSQWQDTDCMRSGHHENCVVLDGDSKILDRYRTYVEWPDVDAIGFAEAGLRCIGFQMTKCEYCDFAKSDWSTGNNDNWELGHRDGCKKMMFINARKGHI